MENIAIRQEANHKRYRRSIDVEAWPGHGQAKSSARLIGRWGQHFETHEPGDEPGRFCVLQSKHLRKLVVGQRAVLQEGLQGKGLTEMRISGSQVHEKLD